VSPKPSPVRSNLFATFALATVAAILLYALVSMSRETTFGVKPVHTVRTKSRVGIDYARKSFFGKVRSKRPRCRAARLVVLVKARSVLSDIIVRRKTTGPQGRYRMRLKQRPTGRFYVRAIPRGRPGYLHFHRCRGDQSRAIRIRPLR
jgi:hypothetical protein